MNERKWAHKKHPRRMNPVNIHDLEAALLGIFLLEGDIPKLPGDFLRAPRHRQIYAAMASLPPAERNPLTIAQRLAGDGPLPLSEILALANHPWALIPLKEHYLEMLWAEYRARLAVEIANDAAKGQEPSREKILRILPPSAKDPYTKSGDQP